MGSEELQHLPGVIILYTALVFIAWGCFGFFMHWRGSVVFWSFEPSWTMLGVLALMGALTGLGIEAGSRFVTGLAHYLTHFS